MVVKSHSSEKNAIFEEIYDNQLIEREIDQEEEHDEPEGELEGDVDVDEFYYRLFL